MRRAGSRSAGFRPDIASTLTRLVRHDIVHRISLTREDEPIELAPADVAALALTVERLACDLQNALPCPPSHFDRVSDPDQ